MHSCATAAEAPLSLRAGAAEAAEELAVAAAAEEGAAATGAAGVPKDLRAQATWTPHSTAARHMRTMSLQQRQHLSHRSRATSLPAMPRKHSSLKQLDARSLMKRRTPWVTLTA